LLEDEERNKGIRRCGGSEIGIIFLRAEIVFPRELEFSAESLVFFFSFPLRCWGFFWGVFFFPVEGALLRVVSAVGVAWTG